MLVLNFTINLMKISASCSNKIVFMTRELSTKRIATGESYDGNGNGADCHFPFTYKGEEYKKCTTVDYGETEWCSTTPNYDIPSSGVFFQCCAIFIFFYVLHVVSLKLINAASPMTS